MPINNSSMYEQNSFNGMSILTIRRPSLVESEGWYRCRVDYHRDSYGNFSLVSREANFEIPRKFSIKPLILSASLFPQNKDTRTIKNT